MTTGQRAPANAPKKFPLVPVIFGVVAVALIGVVVFTFDDGGATDELGSPEITSGALPLLPDGAADPALGMTIPEVVGADFEGNEVAITDDGHAKVLLFLAHWCQVCQREAPIVQDWIDTDPLPEGVELIAIATGISSARPNYPPSAWLEREGWTSPLIVDDGASSVGSAFGLPAYPFWVFTSADGEVLARITGGIAPTDLDNAVATLAATLEG